MAAINFYGGYTDISINNLSNSGIGFYGGSFGASVPVGTYQSTTFITDSNGTSQGAQLNNIQYVNSMSGIINSATSGVQLRCIPNYLATLNIRFTHSSAVKVQNWKVRAYDRSNINNNPSGVTQKIAQVIHPDITQVMNGSGDVSWTTVYGSGSILSLAASPGMSGLYVNGTNTTDLRHDQYVVMSASPDSIGSKYYALYTSLEYL